MEIETLRYTPAGIPVLNVKLEHESQLSDTGATRIVKFAMKAVAFGVLAERLAQQDIGSHLEFSGFLSNSRNGKSVLLNIQEFL